jgi:hypothetical protein
MTDETKGEMPTTEPAGEMPAAQPTPEPESAKPEDLAAELEKARAALKSANKEAAERRKKLEAYEQDEAKRKEAEMTELEKYQKRTAELEATLKVKEYAELRLAAAEKVGLPKAFVNRLQGETPDELEADAKAIMDALPKPEKPAPGINPTNPAAGTIKETPEQAKARLFGAEFDPFLPENAKKLGGGVFMTDKE